MSSIPLVALSVKQQEQPDLLSNYSRLLALKNMQQQSQMQQQEAPLRQQALQQQVQGGALNLQQQQREADSQSAIMDAWQKSGGDLSKAYQMAAQSGKALPADLAKVQQANFQLQTQANELVKSKGDRAVQEADLMGGAADTIKNAPPEARPQIYQQQLQGLHQAGIDVSQLPPQYPGDQQFGTLSLGVQSHKVALDQALASQKQQESARHNAALEANTAAEQANTNAYRQAELKQGQQRIGIEGAKLNFERQKAGIGANGEPDANAQAIASGHIVPERMSYLLSRNPGLMDSVMKLDPSFDSSKAQAYPKVYADFTNSKPNTAGGSLLAGGVALKHLNELLELNTAASHIPHTPAWTAYQNKADTVSGELGRFYGTDTIPAIAGIKSTLASTLYGNREAAIRTQAQSMGDRLNGYKQVWENAAPSKAYQAPMPGLDQKAMAAWANLDPRAKEQMNSAQPTGGAASTGSSPSAPPPGATHIVPGSDGHNHYTDGKKDLGIAP